MRYNILTYHIGEGIRNLFKNKKSTVASLCIMMATMLMFGIFFIIGENINHIMKTIEEEQGMQVFIIEEADSKEVQEVRDMISSIDGVASATIYTKQDALDEMKVRLKNNQDVLAGYDENNKPIYKWELISNDTLTNANILLFRNVNTNQLDVVSITPFDVGTKVSYKGRKNLLGSYLPDVNSKGFVTQSNYGNIEAIRTMTVLN